MDSRIADRPISRRVVLVGGAVLALTLAAVVVDSRRVRTGELLIQSDRGDLRIAIKQGGRLVAGPTETRSFTLRPGVYDVEVDGSRQDTVSIVKGGRSVLSVP
jgi:hypothetical protein